MRRLFISFLALCSFQTLRADTAWLSNSDVVRGKIQSLKENKLHIKTDWGGEVLVDLRYVRALETEELLWVRLKGQNNFRLLKFQQKNNLTWLQDDQGNEYAMEESIELGSVQQQSPGKQKLLYTGNLSLNFRTERNDEQELDIAGNFSFRDQVNHHNIRWKLRHSRDESGTVDERKNNLYYDYNRFWNQHWYTMASSQWDYDNEKNPPEFVDIGTGIGYQFWDTPNSRLKIDMSINQVWENHIHNQPNRHRYAATWTSVYYKRLWKNIFLEHNSKLARRFKGQNEWLYDSDLSIKFQLTDRLWFNVLHDSEYNSSPLPGAFRFDYGLSFGLGVSW